jgi:oxygen-independent coproporphyrinogen III oxidase
VSAGLYVHFPFCAAKCPYCHFYSVPWTAAGRRTWREGLAREAEAAAKSAAAGLRFDTLYIGGGTPSLLGEDQVAAVRDLALNRFPLEIAEFTLEANPVAGGPDLVRGWRFAGVTRLSVGVQSFDDGVLRTLGRPYTAADALRFCLAARQAGFDSLSIDLMIGVPGETPEAVGRTLEAVRGLAPDHVSAYFLENVEGLPFAEVLARHPVDEDAAVDAYDRVRGSLEEAGLARYEISNFARPGRECRHNLKYWRYEPFLGLGPSASSHLRGRRWTNRASLGGWAEALDNRGAAWDEVVELDPAAAAREALVFGLRLVRGVDAAELRERTGVDVFSLYAREIDELASDGLLVQAGARLWIPADKLLVSNAILSRFI